MTCQRRSVMTRGATIGAGRHRRRRIARAAMVIAAAAGLIGGCRRQPAPPPPRVETPVTLPQSASTVVVPITARLEDLERALDGVVPRRLWSIDRVEPRCIPAQRVAVFGRRVKVTPDLGCRITGVVTRGRIRLDGNGETLRLTLPVHAEISARNIGGVIRRETATGDAIVRADVRLSVRPDWTPAAKLAIRYDWTTPPGVTLFGKRITFTDKADDKLAGVLAKLERDLPARLRGLGARDAAARVWRDSFTALELNHANPPVWLRITPTHVSFDGYRVRGRTLELIATAQARTDTFVGDRPADPAPTPLPPLSKSPPQPQLTFQVPVLADYAQLEPVLARALVKRAARGISLPKVGPLDVKFGAVTIYATTGGRLAVGVDVAAAPRSKLLDVTRGRIWLTGAPWNAPDSERVEIRDLQIVANTNRDAVNLLVDLFQTPEVTDTIGESLTQDFSRDYAKVLQSARDAIARRRQGDFVLQADIARVTHGRVVPTGQGLLMTAQAFGTATIAYRPRR